jgi:hypothetical protein
MSTISTGQSELLCATPTTLADWEKRLAPTISGVECAEGKVRAALLPIIPDRANWEEFLTCVSDQLIGWCCIDRLSWHDFPGLGKQLKQEPILTLLRYNHRIDG